MDIQNDIGPSENNSGNGLGYLVILVTTARGAVPIPDALVNIRENNPAHGIIFSVKTGYNGMIEKTALPAPSAAELNSPCARACNNFIIDVHADGYYPQTYLDVALYDGVTSYLSADLVPLAGVSSYKNIPIKPEVFEITPIPLTDAAADAPTDFKPKS